MAAVRIRLLRSPADYFAAERLQKVVWGFPDREIIPLNELVVLQRNGGYLAGAFEGRRMAGFCFGVPALLHGRPYHYSRMTGVLPGRQDSGIGLRLKLHQRKFVLAQGLDLVKWTFDPLATRNAHFNFRKLGIVSDEYVPNIYPASASRFNRGWEPDRLIARWWIRSRRVRERLEGRIVEPPPAPAILECRDGHPGPVRAPRGRRISVEVPLDIQAIRARDLPLARRWRRATRAAFTRALAAGCTITDFVARRDAGTGSYLLERR